MIITKEYNCVTLSHLPEEGYVMFYPVIHAVGTDFRIEVQLDIELDANGEPVEQRQTNVSAHIAVSPPIEAGILFNMGLGIFSERDMEIELLVGTSNRQIYFQQINRDEVEWSIDEIADLYRKGVPELVRSLDSINNYTYFTRHH